MRSLIATALALVVQTALAVGGEPESPIKQDRPKTDHHRWGYVVMSTDLRIDGLVWTTATKPIRIFDRKKSAFRDVKWKKIERIQQSPDKDWLEREWRWKEGGNDVKVYTDRYYRAAKFRTIITLKSGEKIVGDAVAPIYTATKKKLYRLELHKRFKSAKPAAKKELKPLLYIKNLVLTDKPVVEKPGGDGVKGKTGKVENGEKEKEK
jgi:hypothetical protein